MIYENIGRRSILKGIGAVVGNPLGLFKKAAVATATELATKVVVNKNITKCTPDMIPQIIESNIFGTYSLSVTDGVYAQSYGGGWDEGQDRFTSGVLKYLDVNDVGANIAAYFKNDFRKLIESTAGGEGLPAMNRAFGGVFSKLYTNAANYMGPQELVKQILEIYDYDIELGLTAIQGIGDFSNTIAKIFNADDIERLRELYDGDIGRYSEADFKKIQKYFEKRGVEFKVTRSNERDIVKDENSDTEMSDDDWMATTHGGYEPGQSGGYSKDRVFESKNIHCFTNSYRQLIKESRM